MNSKFRVDNKLIDEMLNMFVDYFKGIFKTKLASSLLQRKHKEQIHQSARCKHSE